MSAFQNLSISSVALDAVETLCVTLDVATEPTATFAFKQGQYLTFRADIDGAEVRRSYSICAAVGQPLQVAIKCIPDGLFSTYAHASFKPGFEVSVMPPGGDFYCDLDADVARAYLCIAAGSGITPVISNVQTILETEPQSRVTLLYGNQRANSMVFKERLCWLKSAYLERFQWINLFTQERQQAEILNGRINNKKGGELNNRLITIKDYDEFFLCGPEGMISEVSRGLRAEGIEEEHIHYELFFASAEDAQAVLAKHQARVLAHGGAIKMVSVRAGGRETTFELTADGENILDAAMEKGMDLPFSCKGGVCATCKAKVIDGEVDLDLNHALTAEQLAAGYVLTCQAHPISDRVTLDFDVV